MLVSLLFIFITMNNLNKLYKFLLGDKSFSANEDMLLLKSHTLVKFT